MSTRGRRAFGCLVSLACAASGCEPNTPRPGAAPPISTPTDAAMPPQQVGGCAGSADCGDAERPVCAAMKCRACAGPADDDACRARDPMTPRCDATSGRCVGCRIDTRVLDCPDVTARICDAGQCRGCRAHAECDSNVCNADGSCADPATVVYVDADGCPPMPDGSTLRPFCQIREALDAIRTQPALRSRRYVRVAGASAFYSPLRIQIPIAIVGPGRDAKPPAAIHGGNNKPALGVGDALAVTVDGLVIEGSVGSHAVMCFGNASLTLRRSLVADAGMAGVAANNCTLVADGNVVRSNAAGGFSVALTRYTITNNFVVGNGPVGRGVSFDDASSGTFAFNTVADNQFGGAKSGGIDCGSGAPRLIASSIVWRNSRAMGASQIGGNCTLRDVVVGATDPIAFSIARDPELRAPGPPSFDYHLAANSAVNAECCVDRVRPADGGAVDLVRADGDGRPRPQGGGWDVGAHEVQ